MSAPLLEISGLAFSYGSEAFSLGPIDLSLAPGETLALAGPNGSGKSTLLSLAAGLLKPVSGKIRLAGRELAALPRREAARLVGYLPQSPQADPGLTVIEAVAMGRYPHLAGAGFLGPDDFEIVRACLAETQTGHLAERAMGSLSGGEGQRVALASVLAQQPRLLLLDEPVSALDLGHQSHFLSIIARVARQGVAVAVVLHDVNLAALFAGRLVLLAGGEVAADGPPSEVITQAAMSRAFGQGVEVVAHPRDGRPLVLPKGREGEETP